MQYPQTISTGCPKCGVSVFQHEGKHYTPLRDYLLTGSMIGRNRDPEFRRAYVPHRCRPEDLDSYGTAAEEVVATLKQLIEDNPPEWLQSDLQEASATARSSHSKLRVVTARAGLTRACPRCNAEVGAPCENLLERKKGNLLSTKHPHEQRLPLPETAPAAELQLAREAYAEAYGLVHQIQEALKTDDALKHLVRLAGRY